MVMERLKKRYLAFFIYIVLPLIGGCGGSEPTEPERYTVKVEGKVFKSNSFDDIFTPNSAVRDAVVDIYRIDVNGSKKMNVNSASTDSYGKFLIETEVQTDAEYLVVAQKDENLWKAVIKAAVEDEVTIFILPLTDETSAETEVYLASKKKHYNLSYYDISLLVEEKTAELIVENPALAELTADILYQAVNARTAAFLNEYFGGTEEKLSGYMKRAEDNSAIYSRDLHFASSSGVIETLTGLYYESFIDAFMAAGLTSSKVLKLLEIYYRIINNSDLSNQELQMALLRSSSMLKAIVMSSSFSSDLQILKGRRVKDLNTANETLLTRISAAETPADVRSAFAIYQDYVLDQLLRISGMSSTLKNTIEQKILPGLSILMSKMQNNSSYVEIMNSYIDYYKSVSAEVKNLLKYTYSDDSDCIGEMMVMLYIKF
jgi:hypothetical protein